MTGLHLRSVALLLTLFVTAAPVTTSWATGVFPGVAARVNGVNITNERFNAFYQEYRRPFGVNVAGRGDHLNKLIKLRKDAMDEIIKQELVRQAAEKKGINATEADIDTAIEEISEPFKTIEEFKRRIQNEGFTERSYREHVGRMIAAKRYLDDVRLSVDRVTDEDLEQYHADNELRLTLPERVRVRHILLTWKPMGTTDDRGAIRKQMEPILERARSGEDFAALADELSDDYATRNNGGDTGLFQRGEMAPTFEEVAFSLKPGEISDPVETSFGVHILRLEEHREARLLPLDEIREQLRIHVLDERMEAAAEKEIERLRNEAEIEVLMTVERPGEKS